MFVQLKIVGLQLMIYLDFLSRLVTIYSLFFNLLLRIKYSEDSDLNNLDYHRVPPALAIYIVIIPIAGRSYQFRTS